ncbi:D-alanyl-D-alanine carboxypeptidase [Christensenellaceae bacterium OttesenSCG-928-L17]|nr:D-alanyl-D-alanine carboxypeptidase [Christensenellaceae bacterium OttesenSCG-928-L17]
MKKLISMLLVCALLVGGMPVSMAAAPVAEEISTKYIVLMDASTKTVLFEKAGYDTAYPASTTKIMTCILALEKGNLDDTVTVPDVTSSGSVVGLRRGETLPLRDALYAMMLNSGNDAAEAIAAHISGSKAEFVELMNAKAKELGMNDTNFVTPSGLDKEGHQTTAYDFALLTSYALMTSPKKGDFRAIVSKGSYTAKSSRATYELENSNKLVHTKAKNTESFEFRNAIGVKTGDTPNAQRCLVAAAERNGITLVSVQFYDLAENYRFELAASLFEWGFSNYGTHSVAELQLENTYDVRVDNASMMESGMLTLNVDFSDLTVSCLQEDWELIKNSPSTISITSIPVGEIVAPIQEGDLVTTLVYKHGGNVLFQANAYASRSVDSLSPATTEKIDFTPPGKDGEGSSGPWLFIILVLVCIVVLIALVLIIRNRRQRMRRGRVLVRRGTRNRRR